MTDKNDIIRQIEEALGSNGTRELAEAMLPLLMRDGHVTFDGQDGYVMADFSDAKWLAVLDEAAR